jgi:hypothetical protein
VKGEKKNEYICDVQLGIFHKYALLVKKNSYVFMVEKPSGWHWKTIIEVPDHSRGLGFYMNPKIGDDKTAPHFMKIEMN